MSKFSDFYSKLNNDPVISAEFKKIIEARKIPAGTPLADLSDENLTALIALAEKSGSAFTLEEVKAYLAKSADGELSEDELEAVAGGKGDVNCGNIGTGTYCENVGGGTVNN